MELLKIQNFAFKITKYDPVVKTKFILKKHFSSNKTKKPSSKARTQQPKGGIVLCGCGYLDGTCVLEATAVSVSMSRNGISPEFYAPTSCQADVFNHLTGCPAKGERNALEESARIARGKIQRLCDLRYCDLACLVVPGGFGVTKTLSTFEQDRASCSIDADMMRVLEEFHDARKPMGFTCAAGILPARLFPYVKVTLGMKGKKELWPYQYILESACEMGAEVEQREVTDYSFDKQHMVFTTPAFLYNGSSFDTFEGISNMMQNLCKYVE